MKDIVRDLRFLDNKKSFLADPSTFMKVISKRMDIPVQLKDQTTMLYDYVL